MAQNGKRTELDADGNVMMVHTSDGEAWKRFDALHKEKMADPRHPRVAVSADGFNVFGQMATPYNCWPMFVIPLNLPPRADYAKKEHFPDVDNSRAHLSGEEYECVHVAT